MSKVKSEVIDEIAILEADAILSGLKNPELAQNPSFLEKVRKFLKDNDFKTTPETLQVAITSHKEELPIFESEPSIN